MSGTFKLIVMKLEGFFILLGVIGRNWARDSVFHSTLPLSFVPPIHLEKISRMTIYQDTALLMFEIKFPKILGESSLLPGGQKKCQPFDISCHYAHLGVIMTHPYAKEIRLHHKTPLDLVKSGWQPRPIGSKIFPALFTDDSQLDLFFDRMRNSSRDVDHQNLVVLHRVNRFAAEIDKSINDLKVNLMDDNVQINNDLNSFHQLSFKKTQFDWLTNSLESCKTGRIPIQWIPPGLFYTKLNELNVKLGKLNFTLSIPPNDPGAYFDLSSLAECIVTNTKAVVALHVPYRRLEDKWEVYDPIPTKFTRGDGTTCQIYPAGSSIPSLISRSKGRLEIINNFMPHCDLTKDFVCLIPPIYNARRGQVGQSPVECMKGILDGRNVQELQKLCVFRCAPSSKNIDLINGQTLRVTGAHEIEMSCDTGSTKILTSVRKIGAIDLTLKCSCQFTIDNDEPLKSSTGCVDDSDLEVKDLITQVIPNVWSTLSNTSGPNVHDRGDFSMFDHAWDKKVLVLRGNDDDNHVGQFKAWESKTGDEESDGVTFDIWKILCILNGAGLVLMSIVSWTVMQYLIFKVHKLDQKIRRGSFSNPK